MTTVRSLLTALNIATGDHDRDIREALTELIAYRKAEKIAQAKRVLHPGIQATLAELASPYQEDTDAGR